MGSSNTIFRSSNEYTYLPAVTSFTDDAQQLPNETNIENQDEVIDNMNNNEVIEEIQEGTEEPVKQIPPATAKE